VVCVICVVLARFAALHALLRSSLWVDILV
jgi:hypothetical protein